MKMGLHAGNVKDEKASFPDTAHAKEGGFFKENPHKVFFPDSELFKKWVGTFLRLSRRRLRTSSKSLAIT